VQLEQWQSALCCLWQQLPPQVSEAPHHAAAVFIALLSAAHLRIAHVFVYGMSLAA
jgi:hypothetical protein